MLGHSPATLQTAISTAVEFEKRINQRRELHAESEGPNRVRKVFCNAIDTQETGRDQLSAVLYVFPKNPGCTPAGKVSPEDSQGPAISGTTPTARSSKRARKNLIGAPTQSKKGKTFHSRVNEFGIDLESPARILGPLTWERGNAGRDQGFRDENVSLVDDIHIQETFDAVETTETVERKSGNIDGIEFVRRIENIGPVEEIVGKIVDIEPVEEIVEKIVDIEPVKGIVEKIVNIETVEEIVEKIVDIEPVKGIVEKIVNIEPVEGIVEEIMDVEAVEGIVEEVENIVPVEEVVERFEHVVDGIEFKPARNVESIAECQSGKSHTSLLTKEESGKSHTSLLTEEESGKSHTSLLTEEESGKAEDENENTHTPLLMEEESGTPRNMDRIDYRLGQLEIGSQRSGIATRDVFPIKMNDQLRRRNVEMIHTRRQEASSVKNISSLRDPGYKWQSVDLLSGSEVEVFEPIKRRWSDSRGRCIANTKEEIEEIDCTESSPKIMRTLASIFLIVPIEYSPNQTVTMENENEVDNNEHEEIEIIMVHHIPAAPQQKIEAGEIDKNPDDSDDEEEGARAIQLENRWVPIEAPDNEPRVAEVRPFERLQIEAPDDDAQEIQILYEGPEPARIDGNLADHVQPGNNQIPMPAAMPIREALNRLRDLGPRQPVGEDEGYVSGEEEDFAREPLHEHIREAGPFMNAANLINFDVEMMELLHQEGADPRQREEPILIENNHMRNQHPLYIEIHLGEFGNPLPAGLAALERAPAPGLYQAVPPFNPAFVPHGPGAEGLVEALHHGIFRMRPQDADIQVGHAHGAVAISPDKTIWRCHGCVMDHPDAFDGYLGWTVFEEHVLGLTIVLHHIYCVCGRIAFFYGDIDGCRTCLDMLRCHWTITQAGVRLRAQFPPAGIAFDD
ncbi:hypothetical protein QAD02_021537 [Eretmocerus hayati]|uniref:Uncharacterized protein n=1 Tax=Eretmocerus hayati TaxID=131215 RepID=A0ACC2PT14_9HYME|nr:hypothetical protein QAD02_021537 [Eretmocerus hayati]